MFDKALVILGENFSNLKLDVDHSLKGLEVSNSIGTRKIVSQGGK